MSIASEIARLYGERENIRVAIVAKGEATPVGTPLAGMPARIAAITTGGGATVPSAFVGDDWTATAGIGSIVVDITHVPSNGGSAITALQYSLDDGATWTNLTGTGTGVRTISGLTGGVAYPVELRAVNAVGASARGDIKTRTPSAVANIVATLLTGSPFGFAIVPGDTAITRCYVETTGAAATTPCTNGQEVGTIHCITTNQYITYPTGVRPVYNSAGASAWLTMQVGGKLFHTQTAYTGAGNMIACGAFRRDTGQTDNPYFFGMTNGTNSLWNSPQRGGVQQAGFAVDLQRNGGGQVASFASLVGESLVIRAVLGETAYQGDAWRTGTGTTTGTISGTYSDRAGWNVNRAYFGSAPDEAPIYEGRIYGAMIARVDATTPQLEDLADYMAALVGITI